MSAFLGLPLPIWGEICLTVAIIYLFIWPKPRKGDAPRPPWLQLILRWAHPLVWVMLAGVCFVLPGGNQGLAQVLALLALLTYAVFMSTLLYERRRTRKKPGG
jgi:hypothetical protein